MAFPGSGSDAINNKPEGVAAIIDYLARAKGIN
jgi:hypothetical protein